MSAFTEMREAVNEAGVQLRAADTYSNDMAKLLIGRLRNVKGYDVLKDLKRELSHYNAQTGRWKD